MASPSVSFRISRSAEDLAGTLHLLSQRLVQLEQRLADLEAQRDAAVEPDSDPALETSLANAERLLLDCRALLGGALEDPAAGSASASELEESEVEGLGTLEALAGDEPLQDPVSIAADHDDDQGTVSLFDQDRFDEAVA